MAKKTPNPEELDEIRAMLAEVRRDVREQCTEDRRRMWIRLTAEGERRLERTVSALRTQRAALVAAMDGVASDVRAIADADDERARRAGTAPR